MKKSNQIPIYSLDNFRKGKKRSELFQVEVFDANRHFEVTYPHRHDFYEVLFLSNGSGKHEIDGNIYEIKPPCIFFLSPGQAHNVELSQDIGGYIFLFTSEFYLLNQKNSNRLLEFPFFFSLNQSNSPLFLDNKKDSDFFITLFVRGCQEIAKQDFSDEIIRSLLDLILLTSNQLYPKEEDIVQKGKGHLLVKKFLLLIEENYQKNLRVNEYAEMLAVTANHLTQVTKQLVGKTCIDLLQQKQIIETKKLLQHTNLSVTEIAELLNFSDQSYFTKYFKKNTGSTPLAYRRESMKNT